MVQFFEHKPGPTFGESLGKALGTGMMSFSEQFSKMREPDARLKGRKADLMESISERLKMGQQGQQGQPGGSGQQGSTDLFTPQEMQALALEFPEFAKAQSETRKADIENKKLNLSETKDYRKQVDNEFKDYHGLTNRLDKMESLNKTGKLPGVINAVAAEKLGLPPGIFNPESEEFDKLSKDMLKNISTFFPGRVNIVEVENFLKTIPDLKNSQEGREKIISNIRLLSKPTELAYQAKRDIMKENGGIPPLDLFDKVQERIAPQLDVIAEQFNNRDAGTEETVQAETFESLPSPEQYKGKKMRDTNTGKIYESMGSTWRLAK